MGTQNISLLSLPVIATGTVTANRFITPAYALAGADVNTLGVGRTSGITGDPITVDVLGTAVVEAGAAVSAGATIKSDSTGRAITWVTSGAKVALALEAASAAGQMIEVLLIPNVA